MHPDRRNPHANQIHHRRLMLQRPSLRLRHLARSDVRAPRAGRFVGLVDVVAGGGGGDGGKGEGEEGGAVGGWRGGAGAGVGAGGGWRAGVVVGRGVGGGVAIDAAVGIVWDHGGAAAAGAG